MPADQNRDGRPPSIGIDASGLADTLEELRPRLRRMISLRLDPRLRRRIDSSDVLQESFVEVLKRFDEYRSSPDMPFFVWVRYLTAQKLLELHRRHFGAERRDVRREAAGSAYPEASTISLARALADREAGPSELASRKEQIERLESALERLGDVDREILLLKHFEYLTTDECAAVLGLTPAGVSSRHMRAASRLRAILPDAGATSGG